MLAESLFFSAVLFTIGVVGVLTRRNAIIIFMCVELMLNAVNLTFVAFAQVYGAAGQVFVVLRHDGRRRRGGRGARDHHRAVPAPPDGGPSEHQSPQRLMLLQHAAPAGAHPLAGTVAECVWLLPLLPLLGFVLNGLLSLDERVPRRAGRSGARAHGDEAHAHRAHARARAPRRRRARRRPPCAWRGTGTRAS